MKSPEKLRNRLLTLAAITFGAVAAARLWASRMPASHITDKQAVQMGFASQADFEDYRKTVKTIVAHGVNEGHFTDDDFAQAKRAIDGGSESRREMMIFYMGGLRGADQHKKALALMSDQPLSPPIRSRWTNCIKHWLTDKSDPHVLEKLRSSANPNARSMAQELSHGAP